ncbi:MAG TPA: hypothetical protein VL425_06710 [Rudaea sp.]|nr:hypothetical protein [Rudaea sp.]
MKRSNLAIAVLAGLCVAAAASAAQRNQTLFIQHNTEGSQLRAGDALVANGDGQDALYQGNVFVRMVQDPDNLVATHSSSKPVYVTDAEGAMIRGSLANFDGDVFVSEDAPEIVYYRKEIVHARGATFAGYGAAHGGGGSSGSADLTLHGGNVLITPTSYSIFWGSYGTDIQSGMAKFFNGFSASSIANASSEYYGTSNGYVSGKTTNGAVFSDSNPPKRALSTSSAVAEACKVSNNNPDPNGVYFIFTSTGAGHVSYCAWHSWGSCSNGAQVQVAYMPNISGLAGCNPNSDVSSESEGLAALANVTSHEFSEAITDPRGTGWTDSSGAENGDKCAWAFHNDVNFSNGSVWKLQMEWSNNAYNTGSGYANTSGQLGCLQ